MKYSSLSHGNQAAPPVHRSCPGFTLLELLLTLVLILLFAGAVILGFGTLDRQARLDEGAAHLETLFRYARAQAANSGRQVRMVFGPAPDSLGTLSLSAGATNVAPSLEATKAGVSVLWEPDPLNAPGRFETLAGAALLVDQVNELVTVQEVAPPGARLDPFGTSPAESLPALPPGGQTNDLAVGGMASAPPARPALTCYPDGSSDSMQLVLSAVGGEDPRRAVVQLWGLSGTSQRQLLTPNSDTLGDGEDWDPFEEWDAAPSQAMP